MADRFVAQVTEERDGLGQPFYEVIDLAHAGRVEQTFDGYFARQDAHGLAANLNRQEAAMATGEE